LTGRRTRCALVVLAGLLAGCSEGMAPIASPESVPPGHDEPLEAAGDRTSTVRIRVMAANLTTGNNQAYQDPGIRIFKGLAPDVVLIQELNHGSSSPAEIRAFVDEAFGAGFHYYREGGAQIPNGVISRWPIVEAGEWDDPHVDNRDFAWARIDIPGAIDLYAVSVHLLTSSASDRNAEMSSLVQRLAQIPAGAYVVVGGDLNTSSRDEAALATARQAVVVAAPYPTDRHGNGMTNASRAKPYDWLLAGSALHSREVPVAIGSSTFPSGLVVDTRVYAPLAEIAPALAGDSGASNMQHMGVVRDFVVTAEQSPPPPSEVTVLSPNGGESWAAGAARSITWSASEVEAVKVEVALDGVTWEAVADGVAASAGSVAWTVPQVATTSARVRVSEAGGPSDVSDGPFTITVAPPPAGRVFLNEVLANEPGADQAGEFVEILNGGSAPVDLSGYTISDVRARRHVFASGTILAPGRAIVVYGHESGIPAGVPSAIGSSTGLLSITNTGDTMTLRDRAGAAVDSVTFGSSLAAQNGLSMNRDPDADAGGTFVTHLTLSPELASPGRRADGTSFGDPQTDPGGVTAESEPNDSAAAADGPLGPGVPASGAVATTTDADWFQVTLPAGRATISLAIDGTADLDWYLYAAADPTRYLARGYTTANPEVKTYDAAAGTYLVKVVGYQGARAGYRLTVSPP
jgi:endonuclease/exonuclease/phosphatase family metal-dependent hydrolase